MVFCVGGGGGREVDRGGREGEEEAIVFYFVLSTCFSFFFLLPFSLFPVLTWARTRWTERAVSTRRTTREVSLFCVLFIFFVLVLV